MNYVINSFPIGCADSALYDTRVSVTSGTYGDGVYYCQEDGTLTITTGDNVQKVLSCSAGIPYNIFGSKSVVVTSGTFHRA